MKSKLLFLLALSFTALTVKSQCNSTQTIGLVVSTTTAVNMSSPFTIKVCGTGFAHDTSGNNGRIYYMETGSQVKLKNNSTTLVYMHTGSTLTIQGNGTVVIYKENGATVIGTSMNQTTCTTVSYPASPGCTTTGIRTTGTSELVSIYPNPVKDQLNLHSENNFNVKGSMINVLGKVVKDFVMESEMKTIDVSDLNAGVYYMILSENGKVVSTNKIMVTK